MADEQINSDKLAARELPSAVNTQALIDEHLKVTGGKVRTRFPPEPNGYLHVGHAKSMNMNFSLAFEKLGVPLENRQTFFRYDDTNPEAESQEYINSLAEDVAWMGWKPNPTTFSSDYFDILYELAVKLIKSDKAYVCHQTKDQIEACREIAKAKVADPSAPGDPCSPFRNRPVEESLRLFEDMKHGKYSESGATLRMKMDMSSPNPNMWDQVAYRIKYVPHPHAGDKWCIYPTYDYTHCIIDSLEHIDYSICTLEFESRRESYYWLLEALDMYRPKVYEMSRLNISFTVLSKRRLLKLVNGGMVRGWDDPRMPTIKVMAVLDPVLVVFSNATSTADSPVLVEVPDFPFDPSRGHHTVPFGDSVYIDAVDFREKDAEDYFGLAPNKAVTLKYAHKVFCESFEKNDKGEVVRVVCKILPEDSPAPKGTIQWVPAAQALPIEVRLYDHLFTVEEPDDNWESQLNPLSEVVKERALADPSLIKWNPSHEQHFQFERLGFFVVDKDSRVLADTPLSSSYVFNLTVALKDSKPKVAGAPSRSRKEEQAKQLADKLARMSIPPEQLFRGQTDLYSQFDAEGVPTHDASGKELSKSAVKKLKKDWEKQKRLFESSNGNTGAVGEAEAPAGDS